MKEARLYKKNVTEYDSQQVIIITGNEYSAYGELVTYVRNTDTKKVIGKSSGHYRTFANFDSAIERLESVGFSLMKELDRTDINSIDEAILYEVNGKLIFMSAKSNVISIEYDLDAQTIAVLRYNGFNI